MIFSWVFFSCLKASNASDKNTEFVSISSLCYLSKISYDMLETGYPDHFENSATYTCTIQQPTVTCSDSSRRLWWGRK